MREASWIRRRMAVSSAAAISSSAASSAPRGARVVSAEPSMRINVSLGAGDSTFCLRRTTPRAPSQPGGEGPTGLAVRARLFPRRTSSLDGNEDSESSDVANIAEDPAFGSATRDSSIIRAARRRRRCDHRCSITAANPVARKQIAQAASAPRCRRSGGPGGTLRSSRRHRPPPASAWTSRMREEW